MLKEKSRIAEDIQKYLQDGKFVNTVPFRDFYTKMKLQQANTFKEAVRTRHSVVSEVLKMKPKTG